MTSISEKIATQLKAVNPKVETKVVDAIVDREVTKRSTTIVQGLDKLDKLEKDFAKIRPDVETFAGDNSGTQAGAVYSKSAWEGRKKAEAAIAKLTAAIDKALNGDLNDLNKLTQGGD